MGPNIAYNVRLLLCLVWSFWIRTHACQGDDSSGPAAVGVSYTSYQLMLLGYANCIVYALVVYDSRERLMSPVHLRVLLHQLLIGHLGMAFALHLPSTWALPFCAIMVSEAQAAFLRDGSGVKRSRVSAVVQIVVPIWSCAVALLAYARFPIDPETCPTSMANVPRELWLAVRALAHPGYPLILPLLPSFLLPVCRWGTDVTLMFCVA